MRKYILGILCLCLLVGCEKKNENNPTPVQNDTPVKEVVTVEHYNGKNYLMKDPNGGTEKENLIERSYDLYIMSDRNFAFYSDNGANEYLGDYTLANGVYTLKVSETYNAEKKCIYGNAETFVFTFDSKDGKFTSDKSGLIIGLKLQEGTVNKEDVFKIYDTHCTNQ